MSYMFYKSLHLGSLFLLFFSLGGLWLFHSMDKEKRAFKKQLLILHGISWFLVILAGFGLIARLNVAFPWPLWIYVKLFIGIFLGFAPLLFRKTGKKSGRKKASQGMFVFLICLIIFAVFSVYRKF